MLNFSLLFLVYWGRIEQSLIDFKGILDLGNQTFLELNTGLKRIEFASLGYIVPIWTARVYNQSCYIQTTLNHQQKFRRLPKVSWPPTWMQWVRGSLSARMSIKKLNEFIDDELEDFVLPLNFCFATAVHWSFFLLGKKLPAAAQCYVVNVSPRCGDMFSPQRNPSVSEIFFQSRKLMYLCGRPKLAERSSTCATIAHNFISLKSGWNLVGGSRFIVSN